MGGNRLARIRYMQLKSYEKGIVILLKHCYCPQLMRHKFMDIDLFLIQTRKM